MGLMGLMGLRAQQCDTIDAFPWMPNLSSLSCWEITGNGSWMVSSAQTIICYLNSGVTTTGYMTITTPHLRLDCDSSGLRLWWKDKRNYMYPNLKVMVLKEDGMRDTLYTADMGTSFTQHSVSLATYVGQTVRITFEVRLPSGGYDYRGALSDIGIYSQYLPLGTLTVPGMAVVGDSVQAVLSLSQGLSPISYSWHSAMLGDLVAADTLRMVYPSSGWDTLTVTASNAYGTLSRSAKLRVHECPTVATFPWREDFDGYDTASYNVCWTIDGWSHRNLNFTMYCYDEDGMNASYSQLMTSSINGKYMLSPAITIPATGTEHLRLWVQSYNIPTVRISPTASLLPADFTDTLIVGSSTGNTMVWRLFDLAPYAGQTIRVGLFRQGTSPNVNTVQIDYDTLPALGNMVVPAISRTDSTIACSVELLHGVGEGLTYTWHSSLMDTTWVGTGANGSYGFNVTYTIGGTDTITVVAANAYGTDTMVRTVQVMDCRPVTTLPWREDFDDDLLCWYHTYNSTNHRWQRTYRYSAPYYIVDYCARSSCSFSESLTTPVDAWLVSRAITIPADTALAVRLFWQVGISSGNNLTSNYRVMVSTAADCTDTTTYIELYHDTLPLPNQNNMAQRSVSLTPYAGQTIFIAFRNQPLVRRATALMIDKVEVRETIKPRLLLAADNVTFYHGDTATFTATLTEGSDSNLVYTWHSTLLDSTWMDTATDGQWQLIYGMLGGVDTVTLVASNAYGSDTATVCVHSVIDSLPSINRIAHGSAFVGDTTVYTVVDNRSVVTGLTYTWHSTLLDTSIVLQSSQVAFRLVYTAEGNDTVTVVKSNVFGSSTSSVVVAVGSHPLPEVALTIPARVEIGVAAEFAASINDCSANGRTFTWRSTLLDTTVATLLPSLALMYEAEGTDTLTVIASNAYGADTAVAVLEVVDCSARAVPYTEDFEGVAPTASGTQGVLPACWNLGWNGSNAAYGPHVVTTGGYQYISDIPDNALFMVAGSSTGYGNTAEVSLPRMADSLQTLSLAFDYRFENSSHGTLTVGYYNANNVFTTVKTMPAQSGSYRRDTVSFAAATVPDAEIVLLWYLGSSWYAVVIDNIEVFHDVAPHAPATVTVDSIGITHARVNWTAGVNATAYRVVVDGVVDTTVSGLSVVLHGLSARTQYTVRVASLAGNDTSSYATAQFTTLCGVHPLPYYNDFSQGSASITCWTSANLNQYFQSGYMIIWSGRSTHPSYQITPIMGHPGNQLEVSFRAMKYGTSTIESGRLIVGTMTNPADTTTFTAIDTFVTTGWNEYRFITRTLDTTPVAIAFCVGTGDGEFCNVAIDDLSIEVSIACAQLLTAEAVVQDARSVELSWQYDTYGRLDPEGVLIDLYDLTSGVNTAFVAHGTDTTLVFPVLYHSYHAELRVLCGSDTSEAVSLDWAPAPCTAPAASASADTHSIALSWQRLGSENLWVVEYRAVGSATWDTAGSTDSTSFTIAGLTQATPYEVRVGSLCMEGDTLYGNILSVATLCGRFGLPYSHDFSTGQAGCWYVPSGHIGAATSYSSGGARMDDFMAQPRPIRSPEFDRDLHGLIVRYTVNANRFFSSMIKVGVSDADGQNPLWLDSTIAADGTHEYSYSFENFTGTQRHIIFYGDFITELIRVQVDSVVSCHPVSDLEVLSLSDTAATLQWSPAVWPGQWAVYLDGVLQGTTNDTTFLLTGLQSQTGYVASVSQVCSSGDTAVSRSIRFTSSCSPMALPYSMDFENEYRLDSICWRTALYPYADYPNCYINGTTQRELFIVAVYDSYMDYDTLYRNFVCSPLIDPQGQGVDISFRSALYSLNATSFFEVGVMPDVADTASFIPIGTVRPSSSGSTYINEQFTVAAATLPQPFCLAFRFGGSLVRCYIDDISITASIPVAHELTLSVNDTTMGTVSGAGTYEPGATVLITATPTPGHHFVTWSDSVTSPVREFVITENLSLTAYFAPDTTPVAPPDTVWHTVSVVAVMADGSPVTGLDEPVSGAGTYADGDTVVLQGQVNGCGTSLVYWLTAEGDTVYDNPYTFVIHTDVSLTAVFREDGGIDDREGFKDGIVVHPNPTTGILNVELRNLNIESGATLQLLDLHGRQLQEFKIQDSEFGIRNSKFKIDLSSLPAGTYFLRLSSPSATVVRRLVKR